MALCTCLTNSVLLVFVLTSAIALQSDRHLAPHLEQQLKQQIGSLLKVALTVGELYKQQSIPASTCSVSMLDLIVKLQAFSGHGNNPGT